MAKVLHSQKTRNALIRRYSRMGQGWERGARQAIGYLYREIRKIIPIDTGNMFFNSKILEEGSGFKKEVRYAFFDDYAVFVHENPPDRQLHGQAFNRRYAEDIGAGVTHSRRPEEQYKFVEKPVNDVTVQRRMLQLIIKELRRAADVYRSTAPKEFGPIDPEVESEGFAKLLEALKDSTVKPPSQPPDFDAFLKAFLRAVKED